MVVFRSSFLRFVTSITACANTARSVNYFINGCFFIT